jgi:hypothetical protein
MSVYNHLGPWQQAKQWRVPNAHLSGESSIIYELDLRELVSGKVAGYTWCDEVRPVSWASITVSGAPGTFRHYSWDGYYDMYLPAGGLRQYLPWTRKIVEAATENI